MGRGVGTLAGGEGRAVDEFEIEVSDLGTPAPAGPPRDAGSGEDDRERTPKRGTLRIAPRQRRLIGGAVALAAVGLALLVALGQVSGSGSAPIVAPPDVSREIPRLVVATDTVPWGKLVIDGRDVTGTVAYLRPGRHAVVYLAPPFAPLRCTVSVPHAGSDTCMVLKPTTLDASRPALVLDLRATPDRLPAEQQQALAAATQTLLDGFTSATRLAPGDHYAAPDGSTAVARGPLAADLSFMLNLDPRRADAFDTPSSGCATLCVPPPDPLRASALPTWQVLAHVLVRWRYTATAGGEPFDGGVSPANGQDVVVAANVTWQGGAWQVRLTQLAPDIVCALAGYQLDNVALPSFSGGFSVNQAAKNPADGCVLSVTGSGGPVSRLRVLYRCGVLIAADATTQWYMAALPGASAAEQALAARIAG